MAGSSNMLETPVLGKAPSSGPATLVKVVPSGDDQRAGPESVFEVPTTSRPATMVSSPTESLFLSPKPSPTTLANCCPSTLRQTCTPVLLLSDTA